VPCEDSTSSSVPELYVPEMTLLTNVTSTSVAGQATRGSFTVGGPIFLTGHCLILWLKLILTIPGIKDLRREIPFRTVGFQTLRRSGNTLESPARLVI
jgi:hypothetical protein